MNNIDQETHTQKRNIPVTTKNQYIHTASNQVHTDTYK